MAKKIGLMRGVSTTRSSNILNSVPVFFGDWSDKGAGYGQIDTVVHCGERLYGTVAYTVNFVDVATYWQEPIAQLGKGESAILASMKLLRSRLPFTLLGIHPDSGSEFLNYQAKGWCEANCIELTRSRPHKKNDNNYIEQRNDVVVRKYVGYERYDTASSVRVMNQLYEVLRLYINFFQPSFKLLRKEHLPNGKWKRIYDQPQTPYRRVLARDDIPELNKARLSAKYEQLNPKVLLDTIEVLTIRLQKARQAFSLRMG